MLELAAAYWNGLELPTVIRKLVSLGIEVPEERVLPINVEQYITYHPGKRKRVETFWQQSRQRLLVDDSKVLRSLQHKLGIRLNLDRERWLAGPGQFLGGNTKHSIEECFQPTVAQHSKGRKNAGDGRIFKGPGWDDTLIIPFHDMPGRIKGCLFVGREGRIPEDTTFRLIRYNSAYVMDRRTHYARGLESDCGLAMYGAIAGATDDLVVMNDPILALRLQCWHMQDHGTPAPLVSMFADNKIRTSPNVWTHIAQKPTFWGVPNAEIFRHARTLDANVCLSGFNVSGPIKSFNRTPLYEWLQRVKNEAEPWNIVLERLLQTLPAATAENILIGMELTPGELHEFLVKCPEPLRLRLEPLCLTTTMRTVGVDGTTIREDDGWYLDQTNEQICNAILRIDQAIYHEKIDKTYYAGRILFKETEVPFCELAEDVETETFRWMRAKLMKAGAGFLEFSSKWEEQIVAIATKFNPPTVVKGFNTIGWNEENACFVFPTYLIDSKGEVTEDPGIKVFKRRTPALMLEKPSAIVADELPAGEGSSVFWAVAAAIASNILAPIFGTKPCGIGLVGESAEATGRATAKMLGCVEYAVTTCRRVEGEDSVDDICNEHGWPVFLKPPKQRLDEWSEWLSSNDRKNCVVPLDWYTAKSLAVKGGWHMIETGNFVAAIGICDAARKILPSFLQYAASQRFKLPAGYERTDGTSFAHIVLVWMSQWLTANGGDYKVVTNALKVSSFDGDPCGKHIGDSFIDMLCRLFDDGELALERAGFIPAKKAIKALICFPGENGGLGRIFVPKLVLNKILAAHNAPALDISALSKALAAAGTAEEHEYAGLTGWMIDEGAWNKRLHQWRSWHRYKLRVVD
jgi:hypothetical protein